MYGGYWSWEKIGSNFTEFLVFKPYVYFLWSPLLNMIMNIYANGAPLKVTQLIRIFHCFPRIRSNTKIIQISESRTPSPAWISINRGLKLSGKNYHKNCFFKNFILEKPPVNISQRTADLWGNSSKRPINLWAKFLIEIKNSWGNINFSWICCIVLTILGCDSIN